MNNEHSKRDSGDLEQHVGSLKGLDEGNVHGELTQRLEEIGAKPKLGRQRREVDPLERYRAVPLHAIFLYTSEDKEIAQYILDNWGALDGLSGDYCDIHPSVDQFHSAEDAYDFIEKLDVIKESGPFSISHLPGVFFWDSQARAEYVSFGRDPSLSEVRHTIRTIFDEIRKEPNLASVRRAREIIEHASGVRHPAGAAPIWKDLAPFLITFILLAATIALLSTWVSPLLLGIVLIASILTFVLVGVFVLRHREQLSEGNLLAVIGQVLARLPLLRKAAANKVSKDGEPGKSS